MVIVILGGTVHVYPSNDYEISNLKRTEINYNQHLKECIIKNKPVCGIKGRSILSNLKYFNPVTSTCIDYMHSLLEGVIKNFFKYWFTPEFAAESFCLRKYMQEIDDRLLNIRPPKYVPSVPRSIYTFTLWRAHEYLTFIIYYSIPVFHLNSTNCFQYENLNRQLLSLINSFDLIGEEFITNFSVAQILNSYKRNIKNTEIRNFIHKLSPFESNKEDNEKTKINKKK